MAPTVAAYPETTSVAAGSPSLQNLMPRKPNYDFEKRRKEIARKQKQEEKRTRKREQEEPSDTPPTPEPDAPRDATTE